MKRLRVVPSVAMGVAMVALSAAMGPCCAANPQPLPWTSSHKNPAVKKAYDEEFKSDVMKEPMYLPGLPLYSGPHKLISGITFPKVKGGATVNMRFSTTDDANAVLNFYRGVFMQLPWQIDRAGSVGRSLAARDAKGHIAGVTVFQSKRKGNAYHTEFIVIYKHAEI